MKTPPPHLIDLQLRIERDDQIPAFGAFLSGPGPCPVILLNIQAIMAPELQDEDGQPVPQSRQDRKRLLVSTLMHEIGHALEAHLKLPHCETSIEAACQAWEDLHEKQSQDPIVTVQFIGGPWDGKSTTMHPQRAHSFNTIQTDEDKTGHYLKSVTVPNQIIFSWFNHPAQ